MPEFLTVDSTLEDPPRTSRLRGRPQADRSARSTRAPEPRTWPLVVAAAALCFLVVLVSESRAASYSEVGDAGDTLATAQPAAGNPSNPLDTILGSITPDTGDVDIFKIQIESPGTFSAQTAGGDSIGDPALEFDAMLALFDANGFGIYLNDDRVADDGNARLPSGDPNSPTAAGIYFLAIFDDDFGALDGSGSLIFPQDTNPFPFTDVLGPNAGAGFLASFGTLTPLFDDPRNYSISLTGATFVPEPGTASLLALGLAGLAFHARRT